MVISHTCFVLKEGPAGWGGGAHNCRRAAYAAAPAGAAGADRHLLMQLHGCGPHDPVEPLARLRRLVCWVRPPGPSRGVAERLRPPRLPSPSVSVAVVGRRQRLRLK